MTELKRKEILYAKRLCPLYIEEIDLLNMYKKNDIIAK